MKFKDLPIRSMVAVTLNTGAIPISGMGEVVVVDDAATSAMDSLELAQAIGRGGVFVNFYVGSMKYTFVFDAEDEAEEVVLPDSESNGHLDLEETDDA